MGLPPQRLQRYLTGEEDAPDSLVLCAIDVVLEELPEKRPPPSAVVIPISAAGD